MTLSKNLPTSTIKAWEELTIADDYMFKLVMKHKHICKHLLEIILGIKIRKIKEPETEKAMKNGFLHLYTFKNTCQEDTGIILDDGASKIFLSTKGTLDDVSPEVKNFLKFVDGFSVKDKWVDEIQSLIDKLKRTEKEKVDYMTYQMKIAEEREEAKAEGRAEGRVEGRAEGRVEGRAEGRVEGRAEGQKEERTAGIKNLIATLKDFSASPAQAVEQLVKRYALTESEAKAAVQANW